MHIKEKYFKISTILTYLIPILTFTASGFYYGISKYNYSELEAVVVLGDIGGKNIFPPQVVSEIISKPSFLNNDSRALCYESPIKNSVQKIEVLYQIISESVGFLRLRTHDLNWLKNSGSECLLAIIESINSQETTYIKNGRFGIYSKVSNIEILQLVDTFNLTKTIGSEYIKEKPDFRNIIKYIILGLLSGLLIAYGISNWLKNR
jgi:hypothetical protein